MIFVLTELEEHLIQHHGVEGSLVAAVRENNPDNAMDVAEKSHDLMHGLGYSDHVHDE